MQPTAVPTPIQERAPAHPGTHDEAWLLKGTAARELRAFEDLYKLYYPKLARFVLNMTHRQDLLEEIINDTMVVVWNKADRYAGRSKISTWIFGIAYRKALKAMRRWDQAVGDKEDASPSLEAGPEQQLGDLQARAALMRAIGELSA